MTLGEKKFVYAIACSMLVISFGALLTIPWVIELLLAWTAVDPATVTFSIGLSLVWYPSFGR